MDKKIKVLRIINRFNLGGPTYNATFLSKFMSDKFETLLIGGKHEEHEGDSLFIPENYGLNPQLIDSLKREINFKKDKLAYKEIRKIIREFKPDIVHTHASKSGFLGRYAAIKENVPIIIHTFHGHVFHSYFGKLKTFIFKKIERYLARKSSAIIAISDIQKHELIDIHKIVKKEKIKVIPLGFDLNKFRENKDLLRKEFVQKYAIKEESICIGIIGRLTAIKNHTYFFDRIKNIQKLTDIPLEIFVIGDGELMNELKEYVNNHSIKNVIFTSWIKNVELPLSRLDIVCLTSLNEGTPVSLIEAQAAGVSVVSTDVGGVKNVVNNNETGFVIEDFNNENFEEKLLFLIENKNNRLKMSQNGWNYVKDKFHYTRLCSDMESLYLDLIKQ